MPPHCANWNSYKSYLTRIRGEDPHLYTELIVRSLYLRNLPTGVKPILLDRSRGGLAVYDLCQNVCLQTTSGSYAFCVIRGLTIFEF